MTGIGPVVEGVGVAVALSRRGPVAGGSDAGARSPVRMPTKDSVGDNKD